LLAGAKNDATGALRSEGGETGLLFALMFVNSLTAMCVWHDLFVVPDGCGLVIWFDHDGQIILHCRDQQAYDAIGKPFLAKFEEVVGMPLD
jgi:hypothetical protein